MRVLLLHNRYRSTGGEERAVADTAELLARRGHHVEVLERSSREAGHLRAAGSMLAGGVDPDEVTAAVRRLRAEVVHAHNLHPLFGWRALAAAREAGARTVLHLHNFRLFCAIGVAYRDGAVCHRCRGRDTRPGLRLRCRGSLAEAAVYAAGLATQQPRVFRHTDAFIALSEAHAATLHELGLPPGSTTVLPNFVPSTRFAASSPAGVGRHALVAGRLVEEKGYDTAVLAARAAGVPLVVAGAGPDEQRLRQLAAGGPIRFTGWVSQTALGELIAGAAVVLAPSRSEEACPYAVLDALAAGIPVLASDLGGLPELVGADAALDARDTGAWTGALRALWEGPQRRAELGEAALGRARERFGEDRYHERLIEVYAGG
jgi:glycosyltransferase involved in cell wall biosynthesis